MTNTIWIFMKCSSNLINYLRFNGYERVRFFFHFIFLFSCSSIFVRHKRFVTRTFIDNFVVGPNTYSVVTIQYTSIFTLNQWTNCTFTYTSYDLQFYFIFFCFYFEYLYTVSWICSFSLLQNVDHKFLCTTIPDFLDVNLVQ